MIKILRVKDETLCITKPPDRALKHCVYKLALLAGSSVPLVIITLAVLIIIQKRKKAASKVYKLPQPPKFMISTKSGANSYASFSSQSNQKATKKIENNSFFQKEDCENTYYENPNKLVNYRMKSLSPPKVEIYYEDVQSLVENK